VIRLEAEADLLEIGAAGTAAGRLPRALDGRQEQADQHCDDRDHDEQFHERETM
jgi:hypothetical protein